MLRARIALICAGLMTMLAGCVDAEEVWTLNEKGGGRFQLTVRINADLLRQVEGLVGRDLMRKMTPRPLPLTARAWRASLAQIPGVKVSSCEERVTEGGMRELSLDFHFESIESLFAWEWLACRRASLQVERVVEEGTSDATANQGPASPGNVKFTMRPLTRVPMLRTMLAWWRLTETKSPTGSSTDPAKKPSAVAGASRAAHRALKLPPQTTSMLRQMVEPHLATIRLRVVLRVPGIWTQRGSGVAHEGDALKFEFDRQAVIESPSPSLQVAWRPTSFAASKPFVHAGDRETGDRPHASPAKGAATPPNEAPK